MGSEGSNYQTLKLDNYTLLVRSIAGMETCCIIKELNISFDIGCFIGDVQCIKNIFISHGHIDHIGCLPLHVARRDLLNLDVANYFIPESIENSLRIVMNGFSQMHGQDFKPNIVPVQKFRKYDIDKHHFAIPIPSIHRIPSHAYIIYKRQNVLKKEFQNLTTLEIRDLVKKGQKIKEENVFPLIAYTGDTNIQIFDHSENEDLFKAKILIMESTFSGIEQTEEKATITGHIHLSQILKISDRFENEHIVLIHFSSRYSNSLIKQIIEENATVEFQKRVHPILFK